jgi:hypothetical protein
MLTQEQLNKIKFDKGITTIPLVVVKNAMEIDAALQAAYAAGARDMQERAAKVCTETANRLWVNEDRSADVTDFLDAIRALKETK